MKKFLALALASVMAVSLVACGSTNADTNAESSAAATTTAAATESGSEEPGLKIAIVSAPPAWMTVPSTRTTTTVF